MFPPLQGSMRASQQQHSLFEDDLADGVGPSYKDTRFPGSASKPTNRARRRGVAAVSLCVLCAVGDACNRAKIKLFAAGCSDSTGEACYRIWWCHVQQRFGCGHRHDGAKKGTRTARRPTLPSCGKTSERTLALPSGSGRASSTGSHQPHKRYSSRTGDSSTSTTTAAAR